MTILNFSGVCEDSGLTTMYPESQVIDFTGLDGTNCYVDPESYAAMQRAIQDSRGIHWIDSGDYHYATKLFLERIDRPFALLLLDHHPDMQTPALDLLSCGSWLRDSLNELPMLRHAAVVGIEDELKGECEGFPGRVSVFAEGGKWTPEDIAAAIPKDLPIYISIDKDVFPRDIARTDWDQGTMTMATCVSLIEALAAEHDIYGADLCGALTVSKGAEDDDFAVNNSADKFLCAFLEKKIQFSTFGA